MTALYPWTAHVCLWCDQPFDNRQPDRLAGSYVHPGCTPPTPSMTAAEHDAEQAMWRHYRHHTGLEHRRESR